MHTHILENIHALLDFNRVPRLKEERIEQFSRMFGLSLEESHLVLDGDKVPNRKLLREIADKFEVDPHWLLQN